jgi:Crinkler effector protein N-terminal domain
MCTVRGPSHCGAAQTGESSSNPQPPTMSDCDPLSINCWILGDDYTHVFPVKISSNEVVGHLKKAIKVEQHPLLNDIVADTLILYKVSIQSGAIAGEVGGSNALAYLDACY